MFLITIPSVETPIYRVSHECRDDNWHFVDMTIHRVRSSRPFIASPIRLTKDLPIKIHVFPKLSIFAL